MQIKKNMQIKKMPPPFFKCYYAEMESRGPEDSKNVKTSQAYFFGGFISFFEDFSLTNNATDSLVLQSQMAIICSQRNPQ